MSGAAGSAKIEFRDVRKHFGGNRVLTRFDLSVGAGESFVVIGGSGSGKSVALKCLLGLLRLDGGGIFVDGRQIAGRGARRGAAGAARRRIGMLFQNAALFDSLCVWENVAFGLIHGRGMKAAAAREIAMDKLAQVGLDSRTGELRPAELSGGMKKRVGLARAIAVDPEIILFDEPTTGLDPIMADVINDLIVSTVRDLGATALSITHDMASARKIAGRIGMLYEGRIIWSGAAGEIERSGNAYVDQFIHGRAAGPIRFGADAPGRGR